MQTLRRYLWLLLSALLACAGSIAQAQPAATQPAAPLKPLVTRQNTFLIPFVNPPGFQPLELQLYVSANRGAKWNFYDRQKPDAGQFRFRADADGEYWFALHSVTRATAGIQPANLQPEQKVIVDTTAPSFEFVAEVLRSGEVKATWTAIDGQLDDRTLKIEYQPQGDKNWRQVAAEASSTQIPGVAKNTMNWWPRTDSRTINVRARISDAAGNEAIVSRRLLLPAFASRSPASPPPITSPEQPPSQPPSGVAFTPQPPVQNPPAPAQNPPARQPLVSTPPATPPAAHNPAGPAAGQWPGVKTPVQPGELPPARAHRIVSTPTDRRLPVSTVPGSAGVLPVPAATGARQPLESMRAPSFPGGLPPGQLPQMTGSRNFKLSYDVDSVGPSGVSSVDLYITRNGGGTWQKWATDDDQTSPIHVKVDADGVYGFTIVITAANGLAGQAPKPGELADIWVGVDSQSPQAEITSTPLGTGSRLGQLEINWRAADANLVERGVTLSFAAKQDGPWTIIASSLPNTGRYFWKLDSSIPSQVYLRLEVRDQAGNAGVHQLAAPVSLAGVIPRGRIIKLLPSIDGFSR